MAGPTGSESWPRVLAGELEALRGTRIDPVEGSRDPRPEDVYAAIHAQDRPTSAVCLSGGGIRSGVFALGVLQGLSHLGVLGAFDYLSTVSGGGYIGGWFTAMLQRAGPEGRDRAIAAIDPSQAVVVTGAVEAPQVDYVRRTCRYLAPRGGATSADFWTVLATMARNLCLNWLVLLPLVAAVLLIPRISFGLTESLEVIGANELSGMQCLTAWAPARAWLLLTLAGFGAAFGYVALVFEGRGARWSQGRFLAWCLVPLVVGAAAAANFWAAFPCNLVPTWMMAAGAAVPLAAWLVAVFMPRLVGLLPRARSSRFVPVGPRTALASAVAGMVVALGAYWFAEGPFGVDAGFQSDQLYAVVAVPVMLSFVLVAVGLFVGIANAELDDGAIEWWSRFAAWVGLAAAAWLAASALVFYGARLLEHGVGVLARSLNLDHWWSTLAFSTTLPLWASLAGLAVRSPGAGAQPSRLNAAVKAVALPVIILLLLSSIGWLNLRGVEALEYHSYASAAGTVAECPTSHDIATGAVTADGLERPECHAPGGGLGESVILFVGFVLFGVGMSFFVPVNRFSLNGMYRSRLIRTFLGASRKTRNPDPFTGLDKDDDLRVHELANVRPLHVICATLNAVSSTSAGRHQKESESFTFTPLSVGNREVGYRPAIVYGSDGGGPGTGLSLGTAISVSGAAASSQLGMYSTKARSFLLTLANARLGLWFGNPKDERACRHSEPPLGVEPILRELLGLTTDSNPYVYLSDGGHYENLGLWEMVARRCHFIVVSDAGADPDYTFSSLSNAIRRIRLDLGIPIQFDSLPITRAGEGHGNPHAAIGRVCYKVIDGPDAPDGIILYLRATLSGDETIDVQNFAKTDPLFPNDPTSDQFFDEAHFESYRALGFHSVLHAAKGHERGSGLEGLFAAAEAVAREHAAARAGDEDG